MFQKEVIIFSRCDPSSHQWLTEELRRCPEVRDVRPVYISNTPQEFYNEVVEGAFAILYHSKNRGRVNLTDVTDSLYDEELQYLHKTLGRNNVIVVVDDLQDAGDQQKNHILDTQHTIKKCARDLFLFSDSAKMQIVVQSDAQALKQLKASIGGKRWSPWNILVTAVVILSVILAAVYSYNPLVFRKHEEAMQNSPYNHGPQDRAESPGVLEISVAAEEHDHILEKNASTSQNPNPRGKTNHQHDDMTADGGTEIRKPASPRGHEGKVENSGRGPADTAQKTGASHQDEGEAGVPSGSSLDHRRKDNRLAGTQSDSTDDDEGNTHREL